MPSPFFNVARQAAPGAGAAVTVRGAVAVVRNRHPMPGHSSGWATYQLCDLWQVTQLLHLSVLICKI